jgi:hypothetical protein
MPVSSLIFVVFEMSPVQVSLPIGRHGSGGAGDRLLDGMAPRLSERRPAPEHAVPIVVEPVLSRLEALNQRMPCPSVMGADMLAR